MRTHLQTCLLALILPIIGVIHSVQAAAPAPPAASTPPLTSEPAGIASVNFELTETFDRKYRDDLQHWARFNAKSLPPSLDFIYWIMERPDGRMSVTEVETNYLFFHMPISGMYRVFVEYRSPLYRKRISNVLDIKAEYPLLINSILSNALDRATEVPNDPAMRKLFVNEKHWTGDVALAPGSYRGPCRIVLGDVDAADEKKKITARVTSPPDTRIESLMIAIHSGTWTADHTLFRRSVMGVNLGGKFEARSSLVDGCDMFLDGGWRTRLYSTKWIFTNCVIADTFIETWKTVDIGVQVRNCTFHDVFLNPIEYRDDPAKEIRGAWVSLKNCRFVNCTIPESLLIATHECVFENCRFGKPDVLIHSKSPISTSVYLIDCKEKPEAGPGRQVEILDGDKVPHPAGTTLTYRKTASGLIFE